MKAPSSGMIVKEEIMLSPSHYYYRFAHSMVNGTHQTRERILSGAWWLDADTFNTIKQRSTSSGTHLSSAARNSLAIARRWGGKVDIIVRGLLTGPLLAYRGIGTIQHFDGATGDDYQTWMPAYDVYQIYIPGLHEKNPQTGNKIYVDAFEHLQQIKIGWDPM